MAEPAPASSEQGPGPAWEPQADASAAGASVSDGADATRPGNLGTRPFPRRPSSLRRRPARPLSRFPRQPATGSTAIPGTGRAAGSSVPWWRPRVFAVPWPRAAGALPANMHLGTGPTRGGGGGGVPRSCGGWGGKTQLQAATRTRLSGGRAEGRGWMWGHVLETRRVTGGDVRWPWSLTKLLRTGASVDPAVEGGKGPLLLL